MPDRIRVIQVGLGALGRQVTRLLIQRPEFAVVGAVDPDPGLIGTPLAEVAGFDVGCGVRIAAEPAVALSGVPADVAVHTTVSDLTMASKQIDVLLNCGLHVVSSCEELSYPWLKAPHASQAIDQKAKAAGRCVLATGVNPGFLMDFLPLLLTAICGRVDRITVRRYQDARFRRLPFQRKIGAGLTPEEFEEKRRSGVLRHMGLTESVHMIADGLGWRLDRVKEDIEPVIADTAVASEDITVSPGMAAGVSQTAVGFVDGRERIRLEFRACLGEPDIQDTVSIEGDQAYCFSALGGVNGDVATCSILVNAIRTVIAGPPGLHTMADLPIITCSAS